MNITAALCTERPLTEGGSSLFWRDLGRHGALVCPMCSAPLTVADQKFSCDACSSSYPIVQGVPLLMRPDEISSVPDRVMEVFNIGLDDRERVETALASLTKFRTPSHPEFANFFARFDAHEGQIQALPMSADETASMVSSVSCVTTCFPKTLRSDVAEHRSLRLRNGSKRAIFTDERNPLYLSYKLFKMDGTPVAYEGARSPLPCPVRPDGELTIPALVQLPADAAGEYLVRFFFVRVERETAKPATPSMSPPVGFVDRLTRAVRRLDSMRRLSVPEIANPHLRWYDEKPLAEMAITAIRAATPFPADRRNGLSDFDVEQDVARADAFVSDVIRDLKAKGVARPRVLEIGAGVHPIALRACDADTSVVVSDISLIMQQLATIMHAGHPAVTEGRVGFTAFDMMFPPFAEGSFDVICICAAFHHIPLPNQFLRKLAPLLSPEGRFIAVREPCLVNPYEPTYIAELSNGFNEQMFELPEWQEILSDGGFTLETATIDYGCSLKFSAARSKLAAHTGL